MAQRTVHHVFAQHLAASCGIADRPRFLLGSLLPDAIADKAERNASHFAVLDENGMRWYQFDRFRREFSDRFEDPLYLGYYMHLVEDNFYREFCHKVYQFYFITPEEVHSLHRDYHLLNPYLRRTYALRLGLVLPPDFDREPLARVARFDLEGLRRDLAEDLVEQPSGAFRYLSPQMMDEFITRYLPPAEAELRAVLRGEQCLRAADFAWKRTYE